MPTSTSSHRRHVRRSAGALLLLSALAGGCAANAETGTVSTAPILVKDGTLTVCTDIPYEPFEFMQKGKPATSNFSYEQEGLDVAGTVYMLRQLPLKEGLPVCFDVYGVRRMWRMTGTVLKREHVSLPLGEFNAWHLSGTAVRMDKPSMKRDVHVWISDDARRLPLAALGTIDLGAVRATLTSVSRPGEKVQQAQGKEQLKW